MKNVIKLFTPMLLMFLFAVSTNAQTTPTQVSNKKQCDPKACDITKCTDLKKCDLTLCKKLMPQCAKANKTSMASTSDASDQETRVAAAAVERAAEGTTSTKKCVATEGKKCCAKKGN